MQNANAHSDVSPTPTVPARGERGPLEVFAVDGVRLVRHPNGIWECPCNAPALCAHIEQAKIFRELRGVRTDERTVEVQLNAANQQILREAAQGMTGTFQSPVFGAPKSARRSSAWPVALAAASVVGIASGFAYLPSTPDHPPVAASQPAPVARVAQAETPTAAPPLPLKLVNPFDKSEVFEFPAGTSVQDAHDAVAELLLARARERHVTSTARR